MRLVSAVKSESIHFELFLSLTVHFEIMQFLTFTMKIQFYDYLIHSSSKFDYICKRKRNGDWLVEIFKIVWMSKVNLLLLIKVTLRPDCNFSWRKRCWTCLWDLSFELIWVYVIICLLQCVYRNGISAMKWNGILILSYLAVSPYQTSFIWNSSWYFNERTCMYHICKLKCIASFCLVKGVMHLWLLLRIFYSYTCN